MEMVLPQAPKISFLDGACIAITWSLVLDTLEKQSRFLNVFPLVYDPNSAHVDKNLILFAKNGCNEIHGR